MWAKKYLPCLLRRAVGDSDVAGRSANLSLFQKLIVTFTVIVVVPLTISFYMAQKTASDLVVSQITAETMSSMDLVSNNVQGLLQKMYSLALYVNEDENIRELLAQDVSDARNESGLSEQAIQLRRLERINRFNSIIGNLSFNMMNVRSYITIITETGRQYTNWSYAGAFSEAYQQRFNSNSGEIWISFEPDYVKNDSKYQSYVLTIGKNIIYAANKSRRGTFMISVPEQSISDLLAAGGKLQSRAVLNSQMQVVSATREDWTGQNFAELYDVMFPEGGRGSFLFHDKSGKQMIATYVTLQDWKIVDVKSYESITSQLNQTRNHLLMLNTLCMVVFMAMAAMIARGISKPLKMLAILMLDTDFTSPPTGKHSATRDEIGILEESFHVMLDKNQDLMRRNIDMERKKREAELKALQAQISPHFLFNTLNSIRWAAINNHNKKAADMVLALSNLLRMTIINGDEFITLETELSNLRNYAALFQLRQAMSFTFTAEIPEKLKSYRIPKLLLQPLVENVIIHGFDDLTEDGMIMLTGQSEADGVCLTLRDNGVGMDTENIHGKRQARGMKFSGIGLNNVDERIKLYFGEQYGLRIISSPGNGTVVEIFLPPQKEDGVID